MQEVFYYSLSFMLPPTVKGLRTLSGNSKKVFALLWNYRE